MKALITGGAGFIGFNLARTLASRGCDLTLVDRPGVGADPEMRAFLQSGRHHLVERDLLDPEALDGLPGEYTSIWHLAAILGVAAVRRDPQAVLRDNLRMQLQVLDFAARQPALQRVVFTSTSEVYAGTLQHFALPFPTPESTPLAIPDLSEPRTSYMLSKIYGEALVHQSGLPFLIVRPHNVYGPRMGTRHVVPELMQRVAATPDGAELVVYSPDHRRTLCFVQDAVDMMSAAAETPSTVGATLNVGTEAPEVTMRDLATRICRLMNRDVRVVDGAVTPGSPGRRQPDISRVVALTGVRPRIDLEEGLRRTYEWYLPRFLVSESQQS
jgi:UDP-glucose 4-epimerase